MSFSTTAGWRAVLRACRTGLWCLPWLAVQSEVAVSQVLPPPPVAPVEARASTLHGDRRVDPYHWLRDRDDPRTLPYLKAENAHADAWFAPHARLTDKLYAEMLARVQQADEDVPAREGDWWYFTRTLEGRQYAQHLRRPAQGTDRRYDPQAPEQMVLDVDALAAGKAYLGLGAFDVSPDGRLLAYTTDETGGLDYTLHVRVIATGTELPLSIEQVSDVAWANDSRTLFYVTMDESKRSSRLWRHELGAGTPDRLLYQERDPQFSLGLAQGLDRRHIFLHSDNRDSNEVRVYDADRPKARARLLMARRPRIEYDVQHRDGRFWIRINDTGRQFRIVHIDAAARDLSQAVEVVPHRDQVMLDDFELFAGHLVVTERDRGALRLRVVDLANDPQARAPHTIDFDEAAYSVGLADNLEFDTRSLRFEYESLATPGSVYDFDLVTHERVLRKRDPVLGGYDPALYASERLMVTAADGTAVPVSLVWRRDRRRDGPQPLLLYGYGAYGLPTDPWFSSSRLSLLDRGVIFAIAHVRGGGDLGRPWYEAGRMAHKMNSFTDFVDCARSLVQRGLTTPRQLAIDGGSAGGLLVTAAVNLQPELFRAVVAEVPFVDVINTMLDDTLPLTAGEFTEWGNPKKREQYGWMKAYSPYDNLKPGRYPAMYLRAGLNDSQVQYWEPAKYVAKQRTLRTGDTPLLLHTELELGHGGASGRFDALRERAQVYTFVLDQLGLGE